MKDVFLFSSRIPLFDIHQFLIRYLAYYSVLSHEILTLVNLGWCSENSKIKVRRSEDRKNDLTLKRRYKYLFISVIVNAAFYKSYDFESYRGKFPREEKTNFFLEFLHFSPTKISPDEIYLQ